MGKHLPIILPPQKLDAVLDGRATQLRVPLDPQPANHLTAFYPPSRFRKGFEPYVYGLPVDDKNFRKYPELHCPYGRPHDLLYVQEEWSTIGPCSQNYLLKSTTMPGIFSDRQKDKPWQPACTMPKVAARLWLKITHIRVHRASLINKPDALAEGPKPMPEHNMDGYAPAYVDYAGPDDQAFVLGPKIAFKRWFISVYGYELYETDPWLWAVTFQRTNSPLPL